MKEGGHKPETRTAGQLSLEPSQTIRLGIFSPFLVSCLCWQRSLHSSLPWTSLTKRVFGLSLCKVQQWQPARYCTSGKRMHHHCLAWCTRKARAAARSGNTWAVLQWLTFTRQQEDQGTNAKKNTGKKIL